ELARIRDCFPRLVQLAYEADPSQWEAAGDVQQPEGEGSPLGSLGGETQPTPAPNRDGTSPPASLRPPETPVHASIATEGNMSGNITAEGPEAAISIVPPVNAPDVPVVMTPPGPPAPPESAAAAEPAPAVAEEVGVPTVSPSLEDAARAALRSGGTERSWQ